MTCPFCTATLPEENLFCEECGRKLEPATPGSGCICGSTALDAEGYCQSCGRRATPALDPDHTADTPSADCAGLTDRGLRHADNEDRFGIRERAGVWRLVVCDGVSTSNNAASASQAAVDAALTAPGDLAASVEAASTAVAHIPSSGRPRDSASTTLVAAD